MELCASRRPTQRLGALGGVTFDLVAWDAADAEVDLSVACLFEREPPGATLTGGLLHLDRSLFGVVTSLRSEGLYRGRELEALHIRRPPSAVRAQALLVLGLGDPLRFTSSVLERATGAAFGAAAALKATSVAFAPSLIDAGLQSADFGEAATAMLSGVVTALRAHLRLCEAGLDHALALEQWTFDAGPSHMTSAGAAFQEAFSALVLAPSELEPS